MNVKTTGKLIAAIVAGCMFGLASAKLPAPPPVDPAKAEEAKKKAADAAKKSADDLGKAQDRAAERYKKQKGVASADRK